MPWWFRSRCLCSKWKAYQIAEEGYTIGSSQLDMILTPHFGKFRKVEHNIESTWTKSWQGSQGVMYAIYLLISCMHYTIMYKPFATSCTMELCFLSVTIMYYAIMYKLAATKYTIILCFLGLTFFKMLLYICFHIFGSLKHFFWNCIRFDIPFWFRPVGFFVMSGFS
jgi:hypothetical protein